MNCNVKLDSFYECDKLVLFLFFHSIPDLVYKFTIVKITVVFSVEFYCTVQKVVIQIH